MTINNENINEHIVRATITDWMGNILHEAEGKDCYNKMLNIYFTYDEEDSEEVFLNSFDENEVNHGIHY